MTIGWRKLRSIGVVTGACALALSSSPGMAAASPAAQSSDRWDYDVKTDYNGDIQKVFARIRNKNGSALWFTCIRNGSKLNTDTRVKVAATLMHGAYLGRSDSGGRLMVLWLSDNVPLVGKWAYQDHYAQLVGVGSVVKLLGHLASASKATFELSDYRLQPHKAEFEADAQRSREILVRFKNDCGIVHAPAS